MYPPPSIPKKRLTTYSNFAQSSLLFYTIFLHKNNTHLDLTVFSGMSFCCSVETKIIHINGRVVLNTLSSCLKKAEAEICNEKGAMIHRFNPDKKQRLHAHIQYVYTYFSRFHARNYLSPPPLFEILISNVRSSVRLSVTPGVWSASPDFKLPPRNFHGHPVTCTRVAKGFP